MSKRFLRRRETFNTGDKDVISSCTDFIWESLKTAGITKVLALKSVLISEEILVEFLKKAPQDSVITISVIKLWGDAEITITVPGDETQLKVEATQDVDPETESAIRAIVINSYGNRLKYAHKNGTNKVRILTGQSERSVLKQTVIALVLGVVVGLLLSLLAPASVNNALDVYLLTPVKTVFMNALKIIIAPVVFFSIVSCISQFKNLAELGRIGLKVTGMYLLTTVIAVVMAITLFKVIDPSCAGLNLDDAAAQAAVETVTEATGDTDQPSSTIGGIAKSLLDTIVDIVPSNFLSPFVESNTLQLIFLAVLCGIAVGMIGEYTSVLKDFFEACNALFLTITTMIARFIPIAVFCSIALMMMTTGFSSLLSVLGMAGTQILGICIMIVIYCLLILLIGHLNPLVFLKKNREGMLTSFTLSSSSAAMPVNMKTCTDKLGISPRLVNFAIPLGATINMDGATISLAITGLFCAKAYGMEVPLSLLITTAVTIILLSLGAPGVPGAGLVCLSVVLTHLGLPVEAIGLVIGVMSILDMFLTMSNTTGDIACALVVASSEKMLDKNIYYDPKAK